MANFRGPVVVSTWNIPIATDAAWSVLNNASTVGKNTALDAVVAGCTATELDETILNVGLGGKTDENGDVTLDAMVMDGDSMQAGAVVGLSHVAEATQVARAVMEKTSHCMLAGDAASSFAEACGFRRRESLRTSASEASWQAWRSNNCQPNFRTPGLWTLDNSGPRPFFHLNAVHQARKITKHTQSSKANHDNHDTIGIVALDTQGGIAVGVSTNGLNYKLPGRIGDSAIPGSGGYADSQVGGAVATGDGDVIMRFLLSFHAVHGMRAGKSPTQACIDSLKTVRQEGDWIAGVICLNVTGEYGGACVGTENFSLCVRDTNMGDGQMTLVPISPLF